MTQEQAHRPRGKRWRLAWALPPMSLGTEKETNRDRKLAALFVALALAGCVPTGAGSGHAPNAPYQQSEPRDISGMH
jgi:hypothetical protein